MKIETIRKSHKKQIIISIVAFIVIAIVLIVGKSFAKYSLVKNIKIAEGTINYKISDFKMMAMYKNDGNGDIEINTMPESGYTINESKSYCTLDNINKDTKAKLYTDENGQHIISGLSKSSKCYLYFDYLDKEKPVINNVTTSVTKTEITVSVTASDNKEVTEYWYKIDNNEYIKDTPSTSTHKFTGLAAGSTHTIKVYVKDSSGNISEEVSKTVTTTSPTASEVILGNITVKSGTPDFSKTATTDEGVYKAADSDGTSYYFRGAVNNNYVRFANKWWRIIRINGDGSIRLIYAGTSAHASDSIVADRINFNTIYNNNAYVGFKYTVGQLRGLKGDSIALTQLETWYTNNLASYAAKIDTNAGFCGDRTPSTSTSSINNSGGTGTTYTIYAAYIRLVRNKTPDLTCANSSDLYTISNSSKGNKSLTYPIGLITADEVSMAGGVYNIANQNYYLYNGRDYWTLSPYVFDSYSAKVFAVYTNGYVGDSVANNIIGVRPVINLRSNVKITGKGTISDPYIVS